MYGNGLVGVLSCGIPRYVMWQVTCCAPKEVAVCDLPACKASATARFAYLNFPFLHPPQIQNLTHSFVKQKSFSFHPNKQNVHSPWKN